MRRISDGDPSGFPSWQQRKTPPRDLYPQSEGTVLLNVKSHGYHDHRHNIRISRIYSDSLEDRQAVADEIRTAATTIGFFYIKNHGIPIETIDACLEASRDFFHQSLEIKQRVNQANSKWFNGWNAPKSHRANATESLDQRESFGFRYDPRYDPAVSDVDSIPPEIRAGFRAEEYGWEQTANLAHFKQDVLAYWWSCLGLARRLIRVFALALDLPEDYFDKMTSHPDAAVALNYYPSIPAGAVRDSNNAEMVSIGSHTDLQFFTMLWQNMNGGLQVLNREGQWPNAQPIEGTIVVNIGDYLMRITNDKFVSTVHRAKNFSSNERGFNFNETCGLLSSCLDEKHPAKYKPISCDEWVQLRFKVTNLEGGSGK
ncbi:hypothetical protein MAP00_007742 [Monascus purpureus]|nr:hypothetical protein MAP00_007742 [Monascus purpureus]